MTAGGTGLMRDDAIDRAATANAELSRLMRETVPQSIERMLVLAEQARAYMPDGYVGPREWALSMLPPDHVVLLLEYLPTTAGPWHVTDMRDGEPTRIVRDGYGGEPIATVRRVGQGKRARPRWSAWVGSAVVSPESHDAAGDAMPIDWSTCEEAQAACDERLREQRVMFIGGSSQ
jgi:hypothetical protein